LGWPGGHRVQLLRELLSEAVRRTVHTPAVEKVTGDETGDRVDVQERLGDLGEIAALLDRATMEPRCPVAFVDSSTEVLGDLSLP
jgi:hypothetical protein